MMSRFSDPALCKNVRRREDAGIILPISAIAIMVLLMFAGLAVDAAHLYRARLSLQKAADSAALAGIGYTIERGRNGLLADATAAGLNPTTDPNWMKKLVETRADEVLRENLRVSHNIVPETCTNADGEPFCSWYDATTKQLRVNVDANIHFLLMHLLPYSALGLSGFGSQIELHADAQAERPVANVGLLLDMSGSMGCPADPNVSCDCRAAGSPAPCSGTLKIDLLVDAMVSFANFFDLAHDRLGLIPFNMRAERIPGGLRLLADELIDRTKVNCVLSGRGLNSCGVEVTAQPRSNTNICDALIEGFEEMRSLGASQQEDVSYLLFSEGAPSACRFLFNDAPNLPENDPEGFGSGTKDYIHYAVSWLPTGGGAPRLGPSLLVKTQAMSFQYPSPLPPAPDIDAPGLNVPMCHTYLDSNGQPEEIYSPSESEKYCNVFNGCLSNSASSPSPLTFHIPWKPDSYGSDTVCSNASVVDREQSWRKQYYNASIVLADYIRSQRSTFFVVGLGKPNVGNADPYQNIDDTMYRKDVFLTRLANDYMHAVTQRAASGEPPLPEFQFSGYQTYADWNSKSVSRQGLYLATPSASDLDHLFVLMAKRILLRLIK
ncbi:MAG: Tad domain-containing protein [Bdellovibrionota bacterium]